MARKKTVSVTKAAIVQVATRRFLETGYSATTVKAISNELDISTGHLTFYYPTKEHLLSVLVEMLCDFQWQMMKKQVQEGETTLMAVCLELVAMAASCEESEIAKDFYLSAYTNPMSLEIIRRSDIRRAREVFREYCGNWTDEQYAEAETLVSGIEYTTLMTTPNSPPLPIRIAGALEQIMLIYHVPADVRRQMLTKVMERDYRTIGRSILVAFMEYINEATRI